MEIDCVSKRRLEADELKKIIPFIVLGVFKVLEGYFQLWINWKCDLDWLNQKEGFEKQLDRLS